MKTASLRWALERRACVRTTAAFVHCVFAKEFVYFYVMKLRRHMRTAHSSQHVWCFGPLGTRDEWAERTGEGCARKLAAPG